MKTFEKRRILKWGLLEPSELGDWLSHTLLYGLVWSLKILKEIIFLGIFSGLGIDKENHLQGPVLKKFYWDNWLCHISLVQIKKHSAEMRNFENLRINTESSSKETPKNQDQFHHLQLTIARLVSISIKWHQISKC